MMQRVETPQKWHRVLTAMDRVDQKIEQQESRDKAQPVIGDRPGGQVDPKGSLELWPKSLGRRKNKGDEHDIEQPDAEVAEPSP